MTKRILSALIFIPAAIALVVYAPPWLFLTALGVIGSLCLYEYYGITGRMGFEGQPWLGHASFWILLGGFHSNLLAAEALLAGVILALFVAAMWRRVEMRARVQTLMVNLLGIFYLTFCLYPALPIRFDFGSSTGMMWIMILLAVIWAGDIAAMFAGKAFGRTLFAPAISPKKTNEGAAAGLLAGIAAAVLLQRFLLGDLPLIHVTIASLLIGTFGQLGDLAESMLKRAAQVKDSSAIIPGHGGVLDRVDSLLFAIPVLYIYLSALYSL